MQKGVIMYNNKLVNLSAFLLVVAAHGWVLFL